MNCKSVHLLVYVVVVKEKAGGLMSTSSCIFFIWEGVGGYFLSPPVPMHGGLLCVALRLSVRLTRKKVTRIKIISRGPRSSRSNWLHKISYSVQCPLRKSRWAHVNVKLHFFIT